MIDRITEQPFCQTRVSGSTFVNADYFDVFPFIEDKSIDAIICDLPYGTTRAKWDSILDLDLLWKQYERVIKPNGAIVLFASQPFTTTLINSNIKDFKYSLVWDKKMKVGMMNCKRMPLRQHEDIILFYKKQPTYNPQMTKGKMRNKKIEPTKDFEVYGQIKPIDNFNDDYYPSSILEFTNANQKDKEHTTQKPLSLMEYLVKTYTNEGDMVLDNTMGSGTTNLACIKLNRKSIGIEKEKQYYDVAVRRASEYCH
jgi:site-specific DNA-methyltransferase (adenine-specific)